MNASKEEAKKANDDTAQVSRLIDAAVANPAYLREIKEVLGRVQAFVIAAERKLPSEAAYAKERTRKRRQVV